MKSNIIPAEPFLYDLNLTMNTDAAYKNAVEWWSMTGLPMPSPNEYIYSEHGMSVFMNPLGLSVHFRSKEIFSGSIYKGYQVVDENVLQPLYSFKAGPTSHIEVTPGIERAPINPKAVNALVDRMERSGLTLRDKNEGYLGALPGVGHGKIVVANRSAVKVKSSKAVQLAEAPVMQEKIFGGLKDQARQAFDSASQEKVQSFFGICAEITSFQSGNPEKILHASWTNSATLGPRQASIVGSASAYERRLSL